jgi:uncharacterized protein (DUF305 family)
MSKLAVLLAAVALVAAGCGGGDEGAEPARGEETVATGQVPFDQAFIDAMVPHHQEAIEMAKAANSRGLSQPDLEKIANDIISSQQREIDQMLDWREQWFGSRTLGPVLPEVLGLPEGELGMEHGSADEVVDAVDVDATFAEMMIPHHEGAIAMAEQAAARGQHEEVRDLAAAIIAAQKREIGIMEEHASGMDHG